MEATDSCSSLESLAGDCDGFLVSTSSGFSDGEDEDRSLSDEDSDDEETIVF
jgi:hypothetical protein